MNIFHRPCVVHKGCFRVSALYAVSGFNKRKFFEKYRCWKTKHYLASSEFIQSEILRWARMFMIMAHSVYFTSQSLRFLFYNPLRYYHILLRIRHKGAIARGHLRCHAKELLFWLLRKFFKYIFIWFSLIVYVACSTCYLYAESS